LSTIRNGCSKTLRKVFKDLKSYPNIPNYNTYSGPRLTLYTFVKLDGSNLRFEWSKKQGFYKLGTRHRLFDSTDLIFGGAIKIFHDTLIEPLTKLAIDNRWENIVAFCEFYGNNSFAGVHQQDDKKYLTLIDIDIHKRGMLSPKEFVKLFDGHEVINIEYLGNLLWDNEYIESVRQETPWAQMKGTQLEGMVGKGGTGHNIHRFKTKTQWWYDKVYEIHGQEKGKLIAES